MTIQVDAVILVEAYKEKISSLLEENIIQSAIIKKLQNQIETIVGEMTTKDNLISSLQEQLKQPALELGDRRHVELVKG